MNENEVIAGVLIAVGIFTLIYLFTGRFDSSRINKDGYSILNVDKYTNSKNSIDSFIIGTLKVIGSLILIGLIVWGIFTFPIAAIIILLILILIKIKN